MPHHPWTDRTLPAVREILARLERGEDLSRDPQSLLVLHVTRNRKLLGALERALGRAAPAGDGRVPVLVVFHAAAHQAFVVVSLHDAPWLRCGW